MPPRPPRLLPAGAKFAGWVFFLSLPLESCAFLTAHFNSLLGERIIKRDRLVVVSGLLAMVAFSWACTVYLAWDMQHSENALCCMSQLLMFTMWIIMMAAMMVPSAAPMILIFAAINRQRREQERPFVPTGLFLLGYLVV